MFKEDRMFPRFALYGFLKNLRFFDPFIILIFREVGLSYLQIGFLYAIRDVATNILEIPTGVFADAFGRRKAMLMAFGAYIVSFLIFYSVTGFALYALAMVIFAFGEAFRSGTHKALILEHLKLNNMEHLKVEYYGRTRSFSQFGSSINALIAAGLVFYRGDYRTMFLAATIPYVLDFINLASYPRELDGELTQFSKETIGSQIHVTLQSFWSMFTDGRALRGILNSSGFSGLFKASKDYLQPILESFALMLPLFLVLEDKRRSALVIGLVYFVIYIFTSYASRGAAGFSRRFSTLGRAINLTFLTGAGLLFVAGLAIWRNVTWLAILIFLLFYVLHNLRRPMNVSFISDQISNRVMASGLSVESQFTTVLTAIFAPILGALADNFGIGTALMILAAGVLLLFIFVRVDENPAAVVQEP
ncbi:MAG: MFS transporter [Chloroflexota bacterium]|nr:MFS transporter [Chloroflexota bacterium]